MSAKRPAFTLAEAAEFLGVTPARISQLLAEKRLKGPPVAGGRAPKNALRVWRDSADAYAADPSNRKPGRNASSTTRSGSADDDAITRLQEENSRLRAREASARHVALEMKTLADHLGELLESEQRKRTLSTAELASLRAEVELMRSAAKDRQAVLQRYSDNLTTLLADEDPGGLMEMGE